MPKTELRAVAERIAAALFRNYEGNQVQRLVLTDDSPQHDWGGWSKGPATDVIERVLLAADESDKARLAQAKSRSR